MEKREKINITPDKSIYPKLGQTGYTISEALAELIDNSIDARGVKILIDISVDTKRGIIVVEDNGSGMNRATTEESIVLGRSKKKEGQLGQFGIGLKTACMSLGRRFEIETTEKGNDEMYKIIFDEEEFLKRGTWADFEIVIKKGVDKSKTGTKIVIDKLRVRFYYNVVEIIKKHLAERFAPFIKNNEVKIRVNGSLLFADALGIIPETKKEFVINLSNGKQIGGWNGILAVGSMENSGFNLYRYGRLIRVHEKLGYLYHPSKMWITGEIYLDPVPVTHNKREFIKEDALYIEFFDKFKDILKPLLAEAQQRHKEEKIKDLPRELKETLKDNLLHALNKVNDFKELAFPNLLKRKDSGDVLADKEKRETDGKNVGEIGQENAQSTDQERGRTPITRRPRKVRFINIAGKKYSFDWDWGTLEEDVSKESYLDKDRGLIFVILNSKYSMLNVVKPDWFYQAIYVMEGIVEVFLKENDQPLDKVIALRDKLAKQLADVSSEDFEEQIATKDNQIMDVQSSLLKNEISEKLTDNEKVVLSMRLEKSMPMQEIASYLQVTRQRVYQLFNSAVNKTMGIVPNKSQNTNLEGESSPDIKEVEIFDEKETTISIIEKIAESYGVKADDLLGEKRNKELVLPRHIAMYTLRNQLKLSFPKIAEIMRRRDHTTIIHAYNKIEKLIKEEGSR